MTGIIDNTVQCPVQNQFVLTFRQLADWRFRRSRVGGVGRPTGVPLAVATSKSIMTCDPTNMTFEEVNS